MNFLRLHAYLKTEQNPRESVYQTHMKFTILSLKNSYGGVLFMPFEKVNIKGTIDDALNYDMPVSPD